MRIVRTSFAWTLLFTLLLGGATSTALLAKPDAKEVQPCTQCNIVEEGIWNQNLINTTVYGYGRNTDQFIPVTVTNVYWNGGFRIIDGYVVDSGRRIHDDATRYYSYRNMQNIRAQGIRPALSEMEAQERNGWLASCAMALSDNRIASWLGRRACCESTAAGRWGPNRLVCG